MNRRTKKVLLRLANPVDYLARRFNHKEELPPLDLRWDVGPLSTFESSGAQFRVILKILAGLKPSHRVLDIGCGCGQIALQLQDDLDDDGRYLGCDINKRSIMWCLRNISRKDSRFDFFHMDVNNRMYNPTGSLSASEFRFPQTGGSFDIILVKSVFTHMLKDDVMNYFRQVTGMLSPGGKCIMSFFLINSRQQELQARRMNLISFVPWKDGMFVHSTDLPEAIVAYDEQNIMEMLGTAGLAPLRQIEHGSWTGDRAMLSHQDLLIVGKAS